MLLTHDSFNFFITDCRLCSLALELESTYVFVCINLAAFPDITWQVTNAVFLGTPRPFGYGFSQFAIAGSYGTPIVSTLYSRWFLHHKLLTNNTGFCSSWRDYRQIYERLHHEHQHSAQQWCLRGGKSSLVRSFIHSTHLSFDAESYLGRATSLSRCTFAASSR